EMTGIVVGRQLVAFCHLSRSEDSPRAGTNEVFAGGVASLWMSEYDLIPPCCWIRCAKLRRACSTVFIRSRLAEILERNRTAFNPTLFPINIRTINNVAQALSHFLPHSLQIREYCRTAVSASVIDGSAWPLD